MNEGIELKPTGHDGDCSYYEDMMSNGSPQRGICTCGYGLYMKRLGDYSHMYSKDFTDVRMNTRQEAKELRPLDEDEVSGELQLRYFKLMHPDITENDAKIVADVLSRAICLRFGSSLSGVSEEDLLECWKIIGSTHVPISKINGKTYYYMCKEDLAEKVISLLKSKGEAK